MSNKYGELLHLILRGPLDRLIFYFFTTISKGDWHRRFDLPYHVLYISCIPLFSCIYSESIKTSPP